MSWDDGNDFEDRYVGFDETRRNRMPAELVAEKKANFIKAVEGGLRGSNAARAVGVEVWRVYSWRRSDPKFQQEWDEAEENATDRLEDEAVRRAMEGVPRQIYFKGELVGEETVYSDQLLMFLLKGRRPRKFRERHEVSGPNGGALTHEVRVRADESFAKLVSTLNMIAAPAGDDRK